ncbi:Reverse transcriptase domain [Trinorchestia longiramus]|nr:Reverse transcriptase domain [Trinorchestia longiramus]
MDVVHEQCGENKWNARCVEEDSGMRYLVGLDEECNMTVVNAMKDFLVYAWNKRQGCDCCECNERFLSAKVKDERQKVENIRNKGPDGIKEWYHFIQGNNRSNEVQIHELVVDGCKMSDHGQMVKAVVDFWEDIGGMNESLIDEEPVTLQIGEYVLKIEDEITSVEIETFLKKVKNGKASGPDDIPYEFYKHSGERIIEMLRGLFDEIWRCERVPDEWNKCNVVLLHKGGHKNMKELKNYRPIALADTVSKIFCGILNERMKHVVEEQGVMGEEQNGFRRDRRGEDNLFVVSEVIERKRKENKKMYLAFLNIEKANDRVDRRRLLDVLGKIGFKPPQGNIAIPVPITPAPVTQVAPVLANPAVSVHSDQSLREEIRSLALAFAELKADVKAERSSRSDTVAAIQAPQPLPVPHYVEGGVHYIQPGARYVEPQDQYQRQNVRYIQPESGYISAFISSQLSSSHSFQFFITASIVALISVLISAFTALSAHCSHSALIAFILSLPF